MEKSEQKKPEPMKPSVLPAITVSEEDSKSNNRYLKAGATVAAYARGSIPIIIGAAVVYKLVTPVVEDLVDYIKTSRKSLSYTDGVKVISAAFPPRKFLKLKSEIAPDARCERQFARYLKLPDLPNFVMYKIMWEHIRITGSRSYNGKCYVKRHDVRRLMGERERTVFVMFVRSLGNMATNNVLKVQP